MSCCSWHAVYSMLVLVSMALNEATALDPNHPTDPWGWTMVHTYITVIFVGICVLLASLAYCQTRGYIRNCWNKSDDEASDAYVDMGAASKKASSDRLV
ncbi:hypothetical protein H257_04137 [Aphanomyces astaci]|uniref:Uncharacterized protein n=1 Tax=Aphanomyces astaci TaxID=112090 RepID=W4GWJ5_APHAT|nr:hypothetical protein H257_04137 [Aphanomyces astaci]ETV83404.1 hypothetical protein H257_04137 [Aphanomyces astaci]|eukprot:XP_009826834.1 hypothetical protein H257_04137 [Aphanomyces astaci]